MMLTDPIADMLTRIRNGYLAGKNKVELPHSKIKEELGKILIKEGYLSKIDIKSKKAKSAEIKSLVFELRYPENKPAITKVIRVSKPSLRIYKSTKNLPKVLGGLGRIIISTPKGMMTGKEARKKGVGGEIICKVW
ncbi:30S ribosomal protein S8 [Patescibacteria group bacterium]